jgi:hypothetical protein
MSGAVATRDGLATATRTVAGREAETAALLRLLDADGPRVVFVSGVAGIGKTTLLEHFAARARQRGARVLALDGRDVEPSERGFAAAVARALGEAGADGLAALAALPGTTVLTIDAHEHLALLDRRLADWVPGAPPGLRLAVAAREPPSPPWYRTEGLRTLTLGPLPAADAEAVLVAAGLPRDTARRVNRVVRGYPLGLAVAGAAEDADVAAAAVERAVGELAREHLAALDPQTRAIVDAAAVVRRLTVPRAAALLPGTDPHEAVERLRALPFAQTLRDGVALHDAVQGAVDEMLRTADPERRRRYRAAAWRALRRGLAGAGRAEPWRHTADMLFLIENPVLRDAFFPVEPRALRLEPARPADREAVRAVVAAHDPDALDAFAAWWRAAPGAFAVVRDATDAFAGFSCVLAQGVITKQVARVDPVAAAWAAHLREAPLRRGERAVFHRWWLAAGTGEAPSAVQAATWLDIKRVYVELRPALRRVYGVVRDLDAYAEAFRRLGFAPLGEGPVRVGASDAFPAVLDFGPASVDGWFARLAAAELGIEDDGALDEEARTLLVDGRPVALTPREFAVVRHLAERRGRPVPRADLLRDVWGFEHWRSSNVVDVVVRGVRAKLGDRADMVQTVRGVGYRFDPDG